MDPCLSSTAVTPTWSMQPAGRGPPAWRSSWSERPCGRCPGPGPACSSASPCGPASPSAGPPSSSARRTAFSASCMTQAHRYQLTTGMVSRVSSPACSSASPCGPASPSAGPPVKLCRPVLEIFRCLLSAGDMLRLASELHPRLDICKAQVTWWHLVSTIHSRELPGQGTLLSCSRLLWEAAAKLTASALWTALAADATVGALAVLSCLQRDHACAQNLTVWCEM